MGADHNESGAEFSKLGSGAEVLAFFRNPMRPVSSGMSIFSRFPRVRAALVIAGAFGAVWALGVVAFGALIGGTFQGIGLADALLRTAKAFSVHLLWVRPWDWCSLQLRPRLVVVLN